MSSIPERRPNCHDGTADVVNNLKLCSLIRPRRFMFASASWGSGSYIPMPDEQLEQDIPTVCIVDDEASIRASLVDLFESAGMRAVAYQSADDFLDRADLSQAGCILLRVRIPGLHRLALHATLAAAGAILSTLPVS